MRGFVVAGLMGFACAAVLHMPGSAHAADSGYLSIELNKIEQNSPNCLLAFVVTNGTSTSIKKMAYEVVIFDKEDRIDRMTVFDFQDIASNKQRVRQFQLPETSCESVGKLLINGVSSCDAADTQADFCSSSLKISNKSEIKFIN